MKHESPGSASTANSNGANTCGHIRLKPQIIKNKEIQKVIRKRRLLGKWYLNTHKKGVSVIYINVDQSMLFWGELEKNQLFSSQKSLDTGITKLLKLPQIKFFCFIYSLGTLMNMYLRVPCPNTLRLIFHMVKW